MTRRLWEYVHAEGVCDAATRDKDWIGFVQRLLSAKEPPEELDRVTSIVETFAKSRTKDELLRTALERRLLIAPVARIDELAASDQLAVRDYWQRVEYAGSPGTLRYPGPFARFSVTPIAYRRGAPAAGVHDDEVLGELAPAPRRAATPAASADEAPLADVKVLDLMWVIAGPAATRVRADYGATIVRVESSGRIDVTRGMGPFHGGEPGPENSGVYQDFNAGKLGLTLDLASGAGCAVIRDLVRWADVVTESFSPKVMRAWRLDYQSLRQLRPDMIMLSSCLMGQSGPLSEYAGFGSMAAALGGFYGLTGWPDRAPAGPFLAYTHTIAPRFTVAAILAALDHRRRTGEGQYIDLSQMESSLHFLTPALLDYTVNGRVQTRDGNRDPQMAPHGVYPAAGDDRWVAIAVTDDAAWARLCDAIGREELAKDPRYATLAGRLEHHHELDAIVGAWTRELDMAEAEAMLQAYGVGAGAVQHSRELYEDAQLQHQGHIVGLPHEIHGTTWVEGSRFRLSRTPARIERSAPTFGRDNFYVLETILGYDAERIAELAAAGVLE